MVYFVKKREWEGSSVKYREVATSSSLIADRQPELSQQLSVLVSSLLQNAWCQEKCLPRGAVHALGPFRGTAPRGGHSALPRGESGVRRMEAKSRRVSAILVRRRGRHPYGPRPAPSGQAGLGRAANYRRAIAPDRGLFRPRSAPNNRQCASATLCHFDTAIAADSILGDEDNVYMRPVNSRVVRARCIQHSFLVHISNH